MNFIFSVVIPVRNEQKTIGPLIHAIQKLSSNYSTEIIVIDSGSSDKTLEIVQKNKQGRPNLRLISIQKEEFNHGETRNLGVRLSRGKYICFLSGDITLRKNHFFDYFLEDFTLDKKVVAVFGKQIPYASTSYIQKLGLLITFWKLDKLTNQNGILIFDKKKPPLPLTEKNKFIWYSILNPFACYRRNFLLKHPFKKICYGEDIFMGKTIIDGGFIKIYDSRCIVTHSHKYNIWAFYQEEKKDLLQRQALMKLRDGINIYEKIQMVLEGEATSFEKVINISKLIIFYTIKLLVLTELRFRRMFTA